VDKPHKKQELNKRYDNLPKTDLPKETNVTGSFRQESVCVDPETTAMMHTLKNDASGEKANEVLIVALPDECLTLQSMSRQYDWLLDSRAIVHVTNNWKLLKYAKSMSQFV
jgi:hypothetical protein